MANEEPDRDALIDRLVTAGHMTRDTPGVTIADHVSKKARKLVPDYDPALVRKEMPHVLDIFFDRESSGNMLALLRDGNEEVTVPLGEVCPATTEDLIEVIREHYRKSLDTKSLKEAEDLFAAFDDIEE